MLPTLHLTCVLQLRDWLHDKMTTAEDETYRDAKNLHSKYLRHQAFERELAANKDRLMRLQEVRNINLLWINKQNVM